MNRTLFTLSLLTWALLALGLLWATSVRADNHGPIHDASVCSPDGIALGGYDAVSYHQSGGPVAGSPSHTTQVGSLTYRFANAENLATFQASTQTYLPTYLGWCSTNLSMGRLACPDFTNFKIEHGRLLLFEHAGFTNGRDVWNADPVLHRKQADANQIKFSQ